MLAESASERVFVCERYVCQPLPCLSACSMFPTRREREGGESGGEAWSGSREGRGGGLASYVDMSQEAVTLWAIKGRELTMD